MLRNPLFIVVPLALLAACGGEKLTLLAGCGGEKTVKAVASAPEVVQATSSDATRSNGPGGANPAGAADQGAIQGRDPAATGAEVDVAGLKAAMDAGNIVLVDVRTDGEFADGHVPGAIHIPLQQLEGRLSELEPHKESPVYLICAVGGRSAKATQVLVDAGFANPINVAGGTKGWQAAGHPVE